MTGFLNTSLYISGAMRSKDKAGTRLRRNETTVASLVHSSRNEISEIDAHPRNFTMLTSALNQIML